MWTLELREKYCYIQSHVFPTMFLTDGLDEWQDESDPEDRVAYGQPPVIPDPAEHPEGHQ